MITEIQDQTIYYSIKGRGLPVIILHGLYLDSMSMINAIENTSIKLNGFKRIYIDMPGMGQSPAHKLENNSDTMLDLLCDFITNQIGTRSFIVMGYSYGGYLARGIAERFKHQIIGEVLICPVVEPNQDKRNRASVTNQEIDYKFYETLDEKMQEELLKKLVVVNKRTYQRSEADFYRAIALADREFVEKLYRAENYGSEYIDSNKDIHPHKTLIFLGYQDTSVGYEDMLGHLCYYPKATVSLLTNASHSFFLEQPLQFEGILSSWLSLYK